MKFDWKNWNLGGKIIFCSAAAAVLSMFLAWVDIGLAASNGFSQWAFLMLAFWIYPVLALLKGEKIRLIPGLFCALAPIIWCVIFYFHCSGEFFDETINVAGSGVYICLLSAVALLVGTALFCNCRSVADALSMANEDRDFIKKQIAGKTGGKEGK